jgi:hypothetical protein
MNNNNIIVLQRIGLGSSLIITFLIMKKMEFLLLERKRTRDGSQLLNPKP